MNSYTIQLLEDGQRNTVVKVDISLDGSGDYPDPQTIVNCALLSKMGPTFGPHPTRVKVERVDWDVKDGLTVNLWWDGYGPASLWRLVGRSVEKAHYFGGLVNNADQPNGNITFTTTSTTQGVPLVGTFIISCTKQR